MADNTQTSSPIDLGKIIIDGNHALLNPSSSQGNMEGQQQNLLNKNPATGLNDDQIKALTAVINAANKKHAEEFVQSQGVDQAAALVALHNLTSRGMSQNSDFQQTIQQPVQQNIQQPVQKNTQQINNNQYGYSPDNPVSSFFNMLGIQPTAQNQVLLTQAKMNRQKLAGEEPLQVGEAQKIGMETMKELEKIAYTAQTKGIEALTPEAAGKFNLLIDGDKAVKEVAQFLQDKPGVLWSAPSFLASQEGRQYESAVKRMVRNKLRIESGATIGDKEVDEEYKKYKPGRTDSKETIRRKLAPLYEFYQGSLNVADPTGTHRQRASGASSTSNKQTIGRFQVEMN